MLEFKSPARTSLNSEIDPDYEKDAVLYPHLTTYQIQNAGIIEPKDKAIAFLPICAPRFSIQITFLQQVNTYKGFLSSDSNVKLVNSKAFPVIYFALSLWEVVETGEGDRAMNQEPGSFAYVLP